MVSYLRAANVKDGRIDIADVKEMNFTPDEQRIFSLRRGDILITEGSGSLSSVGASAVWNAERDGMVCFQNTLIRLRPRAGVDERFLAWWCWHSFADGVFASVATGANIYHLSVERVRALPLSYMPLTRQRAIADHLDREVGRVEALIRQKRALVAALDERIDAMLLMMIERSALAGGSGAAAPIGRLLQKVRASGAEAEEVVTAFRDGQVTARSLRRSEGYTETRTDHSTFQYVPERAVVVHGLDGFAGAIGTAEVSGVCSPVYHVCVPRSDGDPEFYGRLLRLLAVTGYLQLFATSTRERAVDFRNWDLFGRIPIPVASLCDQHDIGKRIRSLAPLKKSVERSAALAGERRQALISAAVTGALDIPGVE